MLLQDGARSRCSLRGRYFAIAWHAVLQLSLCFLS